ncbi:MAG: OmpA family protein [Microscillaceae bacterium]|jgi:outer membrane protein OmpA-like peptidoglycan-associated protein|nr:OmpA family protein [Microscillaceae bacterium]
MYKLFGGILCLCLLNGCAKPPQITRFEATSLKLKAGQTTQLSWATSATKKITYAQIKGMDTILPPNGSLWVKPTQTRDYELQVAYKKAGQTLVINQKVSIEVNPNELPQPEFTRQPFLKGQDSIAVGDFVELKWLVRPQAKSLIINELVNDNIVHTWDNLKTEDTLSVKPIKNTIYQLVAVYEKDSLKLTHSVKVASGFFTGTRAIVTGDEAQLIWQVFPNIKDLVLEKKENIYTIEVLKQNMPLRGKQVVRPETTTEYILSLIGHTHTRFVHKIEVLDGMLTGDKLIYEGETAVLCWRTNPKAQKIWLEQTRNGQPEVVYDGLAREGKLELKPQQTTDYALAVQLPDKIVRYPHSVAVRIGKATLQTKNSGKNRVYQSTSPINQNLVIESIDKDMAFNQPDMISYKPITVYFDFNESKINDKTKPFLNTVYMHLKTRPNSVVEITGFSDLSGTPEGCMRVSLARAEAVRDYLIQKGINSHRILTKGSSRTNPLWHREKENWQAQENRRAEILIME